MQRIVASVADFLRKIRSFLELVLAGDSRQAVLGAYVEVLRVAYGIRSHDGVDIPDEDWDVLVVLDACRYDYFERLNVVDGTLERRTSRASSTSEWLTANFSGEHEDIVYVSANPRISNVKVDGFRGTDRFYRVIDVWESDWNPELNTVEPGPVTEAALDARQRFPDKRILVHYIQPHAPWIGETSLSDRDTSIADPTPSKWIETGKTWGTMVNEGQSLDVVKEAYADNLRLVLEEVERLLAAMDGRVVVTSDHGECLGEKYLVEHPSGIYVDELVEVPWLVAEGRGGDSVVGDERTAIRQAIRDIPTHRL